MVKVHYYPGDDVKTHSIAPSRRPTGTKLRKSITPGAVLIVLAGRFKGRRVVFLKQLPSGLLLVTGPYKVNGVPLRRLNQAYVISTSTKVCLDGVDVNSVDDSYFVKSKQSRTKSGDFFVRNNELSEEEKAKIQEKKNKQMTFDKALLANVKKVEMLGQYLKTRFTLRKNMKPHDMNF